MEHINVTKLCREADINRSTFYAHYTDIYDVMTDMEDDFIEKIRFTRMGQTPKITLSQIRNMLSYIDKHKEIFLVLLKNGYLRDKYLKEWNEKIAERSLTKEELALSNAILNYTVDGVSGILEKWASYQLDIPYQTLTLLIYQLIEQSIKAKKILSK